MLRASTYLLLCENDWHRYAAPHRLCYQRADYHLIGRERPVQTWPNFILQIDLAETVETAYKAPRLLLVAMHSPKRLGKRQEIMRDDKIPEASEVDMNF